MLIESMPKAGRLLLGAGVLCLASYGQAQTPSAAGFPTKQIDLTIPFAPGGGVDMLGRLIAPALSAAVNQTVIVENRPGASGRIAARYVAGRPADGHSLLMMNDTYAITAAMSKSSQFNAKTDIAPIIVIAYAPQLVVVAPQSPFQSFADVVKAGKAKDAKLSYGACGAGTPGHLAAESLNISLEMKVLHIPYKGCGPTLVDVMGGQLDLAWVTLSAAVPHIKAGKLKAIAVSSKERSAVLPEVPTLSESGAPGANFNSWQGVGAPGGTPENIKNQLYVALAKVVGTEAFQKRLLDLGFTPASLKETPAIFQKIVEDDIDRFAQLGKQINFSLD
jgi:tripartite-type tricarboxylate transporter receptor subunit TctC